MSHFPVLVLVEAEADEVTCETARDLAEPLLAPYDENGEWFRENSRWDWWQIGGRWTGALCADYAPEDDPNNYETCFLCGGTGMRPDAIRFERETPGWIERTGGCNGCSGKGQSQKWPTRWAEYDGDVRPVRALNFKTYTWEENGEQKSRLFCPTAIVTPDGKWLEEARQGWFGMAIEDEDGNREKPEDLWRATVQATLEQHPEAIAVLVDCHV